MSLAAMNGREVRESGLWLKAWTAPIKSLFQKVYESKERPNSAIALDHGLVPQAGISPFLDHTTERPGQAAINDVGQMNTSLAASSALVQIGHTFFVVDRGRHLADELSNFKC